MSFKAYTQYKTKKEKISAGFINTFKLRCHINQFIGFHQQIHK